MLYLKSRSNVYVRLKSARLELCQKLIEAYTDANKGKTGKDVQLEVCVEWKEMKEMDLDSGIAVDKSLKSSVRRRK